MHVSPRKNLFAMLLQIKDCPPLKPKKNGSEAQAKNPCLVIKTHESKSTMFDQEYQMSQQTSPHLCVAWQPDFRLYLLDDSILSKFLSWCLVLEDKHLVNEEYNVIVNNLKAEKHVVGALNCGFGLGLYLGKSKRQELSYLGIK